MTISHPRFLEFVAPGVSKGRAIRWLARRMGVPLGQTLAIGDQWNDLEMLAEVGHGAAMPTAPAAVRAVARYVAPPVGEEGVAALDRIARPRPAEGGPRGVAPPVGRGGRRTRGRRRGLLMARIVADDPAGRAIAIEVLRDGGIVALPTDTVYGIAVALDTPGGIERLFEVKARPPDKGIVLLLDEVAQARRLGIMGPAAEALAAACWPGGLTLVVAQRPDVRLPDVLTAGSPTIGLRVPDHDAPRALARDLGPLPVTLGQPLRPARGSGRGRDRRALRALDRARPRRRASPSGGPASTVVDASGDRPRVLRPGAIPVARLGEILEAAGIAHDLASD